MDEMHKELVARIAALEARVARLEQDAYFIKPGGVTDELRKRYPLMMDKTRAANALGVTRATVYAMIEDGRLEVNGMGKIPTDCVIRLIERSAPIRKRRGRTAN